MYRTFPQESGTQLECIRVKDTSGTQETLLRAPFQEQVVHFEG